MPGWEFKGEERESKFLNIGTNFNQTCQLQLCCLDIKKLLVMEMKKKIEIVACDWLDEPEARTIKDESRLVDLGQN